MSEVFGMLGRTGFRLGRTAAAAGLMLCLAACGGFSLFPSEPPAVIYDLNPVPAAQMSGVPKVRSQLVVQVPTAPRILDTDRIAVNLAPFELGYYEGVRWSDQAPRMVQSRLIESFEASGGIDRVGRRAIGISGIFDLVTELRAFQVESRSGSTATVKVRFNMILVRQPESTILRSRTIEHVVEAKGSGFTNVISAFHEALSAVITDVVRISLEGMAESEDAAGL